MQEHTLDHLLQQLREVLSRRTPALLACSGGLDSRLLAHLSRLWDLDVDAVFVTGPHLTPHEIAWARDWISRRGLRLHVLPFNPLHDERARQNQRDRCYHCKRAIFTRVRLLAADLDRPHVLDGTNASDTREYRPGRAALEEFGVASPLALAGLTKDHIRQAAKVTNLDWPDQPSRSCLMTRLDYGLAPTESMLARLALAEDALTRLGLRDFRLRVSLSPPQEGPPRPQYTLHIAQAEQTRWLDIRARGVATLRMEGFFPCKVRLEGQVSGHFDRPAPPVLKNSAGQDGDA
ncbi:adenine nucleotide alpha-hydrolase family protein [Megalodesulfovibrio gigas]|uniref:Uncharacterized protein n=1 Tax=Megalodesulfovibrio gigas (strain ATCC 19364 / DSM 1382 / NCIMB 9332 / VKM B-1759) TaxID=1121448 RepID=T2GA71_MEGG1|nr:ATP-dependent sacrificial sulfur transferase LarE [Megalodesulfovibrio gigas]AGW13026.1 hypothetical protein DGI_1164 [Megalodesulfovibrio gigas DSM 1382 = ATCC 19364]